MEPRHRTPKLAQAAMPVGQLTQFAFQVQIELVNDSRVEPDPRHKNEIPARLIGFFERTKRDAHRHGVQKLPGRAVRPVRKTDFVGENIRGSGRQNTELHIGAGNSIHGFIDGAVAAGRQNQLAAAFYRLARKFSGALRTRRHKEFDVAAVSLENAYGFIQTRASGPF